jgi:uncharacterized protein
MSRRLPVAEPVGLPGTAGSLEAVIEAPEGAARAFMVICHPHPLHGGTMTNKVVTEDVLTAIAWGRQRWPDATLWLAGFSFGGYVALRASTAGGAGMVGKLVTVAPALARNFGSVRDIRVPPCPWLIVQGDADEVVDAGVVKQWAAQLDPPPQLVTMPGTGHFFHGQLGALQQQILPFLQGP